MTTATYNINEASKTCGLSPSVLRIWELRYGWPSPKRKANGYRAYSPHQIEELKRISELVKNGIPISQLIIDGLPRWPTDQVRRRIPQGLKRAKALPRPAGHLESRLQAEIIDSLEKRLSSVVKEQLQRAMWTVRPQEEVLTALAPVLIGLVELTEDERALPDGDEIRRLVQERCQQLLRRFTATRPSAWVVPATANDHALATLVALVLNQRNQAAQPWLQAGQPPADATIVLVSARYEGTAGGTRLARRIVIMPSRSAESLVDLLATPPQVSPVVTPSAN